MVNSLNDALRDALAAERRKLAEYVGTRENASVLFQSKVADAEVQRAGALILQRLDFVVGTNALYSNFNLMSDADVTDWGTRCWANTVAHLCGIDADVRMAFSLHQTVLPDNAAALDLMVGKVYACFQFFLWIVAGPTRPLDPENSCCVKLIVLKDAILLENIQAKRGGTFGGWRLLDKTIAGLREVAVGLQIGRIKAVATNERIYRAFLRRGFRDQGEVEGLIHHVANYSKPVELRLGA
jgi:hypothetical protein